MALGRYAPHCPELLDRTFDVISTIAGAQIPVIRKKSTRLRAERDHTVGQSPVFNRESDHSTPFETKSRSLHLWRQKVLCGHFTTFIPLSPFRSAPLQERFAVSARFILR
jgi:hypothetical protein